MKKVRGPRLPYKPRDHKNRPRYEKNRIHAVEFLTRLLEEENKKKGT